jgi:hypothetical protein
MAGPPTKAKTMSDNTLSMILSVRDGKLEPSEAQKATIKSFLRTRKAVLLKLGKPVKPRSVRQNAYMWSAVLPLIADYTGHDTETIHQWLKDEFLPRRFIKIGDKEKELRKTTTELSTLEWEVYMERIRAWAATTLGVVVPLPNE